MRLELGADSWVEHLPGFLPPETAGADVAVLQVELAWEQRRSCCSAARCCSRA
jgi:hypothetical protein